MLITEIEDLLKRNGIKCVHKHTIQSETVSFGEMSIKNAAGKLIDILVYPDYGNSATKASVSIRCRDISEVYDALNALNATMHDPQRTLDKPNEDMDRSL